MKGGGDIYTLILVINRLKHVFCLHITINTWGKSDLLLCDLSLDYVFNLLNINKICFYNLNKFKYYYAVLFCFYYLLLLPPKSISFTYKSYIFFRILLCVFSCVFLDVFLCIERAFPSFHSVFCFHSLSPFPVFSYFH